jgi:hypothetical protein
MGEDAMRGWDVSPALNPTVQPRSIAGKPAPTRAWDEIARSIAATVAEKNAAYGDSFERSGEVMAILYPNGVPLAQMGDALAVVRVLDKLFRIASDRDAFGESPWRDIAGYALLAVEKRERERERKGPPHRA